MVDTATTLVIEDSSSNVLPVATETEKPSDINEEVMNLLGEDSKKDMPVHLHLEIQPRWKKWMSDDLLENKKNCFFQKVSPHRCFIYRASEGQFGNSPCNDRDSGERDQHFINTQKCID